MLVASRKWLNNLHINTQLMIIVTLLNYIDWQTTKFLVDVHGFEVEANPIMYNAMVMADSVYGILWVKIVVLGFFWWVYDRVEHHHTIINPSRMTNVLWALVAGFVALVSWNSFLVYQTLTIL